MTAENGFNSPKKERFLKKLHPKLKEIDCLWNVPDSNFYSNQCGEMIRKIRVKLGFTQKEFAHLLRVSQNTMRLIEANKRLPFKNILVLIWLLDVCYEEGNPEIQRIVCHPKKGNLLRFSKRAQLAR